MILWLHARRRAPSRQAFIDKNMKDLLELSAEIMRQGDYDCRRDLIIIASYGRGAAPKLTE